MQENLTITAEQFTKRLVSLCLRGLVGIPKDKADQHILMKSAVMTIGVTKQLSEKELNDRLQAWLEVVKAGSELDRVSIRRWLVDNGYLIRDNQGSRYEIAQPGPLSVIFDPAIEQLESAAILLSAREEMERRKQAFMQKAKSD